MNIIISIIIMQKQHVDQSDSLGPTNLGWTPPSYSFEHSPSAKCLAFHICHVPLQQLLMLFPLQLHSIITIQNERFHNPQEAPLHH